MNSGLCIAQFVSFLVWNLSSSFPLIRLDSITAIKHVCILAVCLFVFLISSSYFAHRYIPPLISLAPHWNWATRGAYICPPCCRISVMPLLIISGEGGLTRWCHRGDRRLCLTVSSVISSTSVNSECVSPVGLVTNSPMEVIDGLASFLAGAGGSAEALRPFYELPFRSAS